MNAKGPLTRDKPELAQTGCLALYQNKKSICGIDLIKKPQIDMGAFILLSFS